MSASLVNPLAGPGPSAVWETPAVEVVTDGASSRLTPLRPTSPRAVGKTKAKAGQRGSTVKTSDHKESAEPAGLRERLLGALRRSARWLQTCSSWHSAPRRLTLCDSVSLGDKRFVALIQVDNEQFLVGAATSGISLLARLNTPDNFATVLDKRRRNRKATS